METTNLTPMYGHIGMIPKARDILHHTPIRIFDIDCYMDNIITEVQSRPGNQQQIFNRMVCDLIWMLPPLLHKLKGYVIFKKLMNREFF